MTALTQFCRWLFGLPVCLYRWLFDFSRGHAEGRYWEGLLRKALDETSTDEEFMTTMRRLVTEKEPSKTELRWGFFLMRLGEYSRTQVSDRRAAAGRMLAALPRLYGYAPLVDQGGD